MKLSEKARPSATTKAAVGTKPERTGAKLVVRALEARGVTHVFGVPGAKIDAVFNEFMLISVARRRRPRAQWFPDLPVMSERVSDATDEPSMGLLNRGEFDSPETHSASVDEFGLVDSQQQPDGAATEGFRAVVSVLRGFVRNPK
jgi:hypothetical protein